MVKCQHENCDKPAKCNKKGETEKIYCLTHKLDGMVDLTRVLCTVKECISRASFNSKDAKIPLYCGIHKLEGMVDVTHKLCTNKECDLRAGFNYRDKKGGLYCETHKLEGMVDVIHKSCIHKECDLRPTFNYRDKKGGLYCETHKLEGMIDVSHKSCIHKDCETRPNFNYKGKKGGLYCETHKLEGMIDVSHNLCKSEWCEVRAIPKYNDYCLSCCIQICPEIQVSRNYKTKEKDVNDRIDAHFKDHKWINDTIVKGGCSKRRPDKLLDLGSHVIIVEIDENKHTGYDESCENRRLMELSQDLAHRPIVFIRFNPDSYVRDGVTFSSCWRLNKLGVMQIVKSKEREWEQRIEVLKNEIQFWIENVSEKTVHIVELFY
jgi:hypothetical protein